ncbi:MAG: hypothetical protein WBG50_07935 [Desulfomonilaceae bacterium]
MITKKQEMHRMIRWYREETGKIEVEMKEVAKFARDKGWRMPVPESPLERLAKEFAKAAREEIRHDKNTGQPYRGYHAISVTQGSTQLHLWIDIDEAPRKPMLKSLIARREQMVGDGLQLTLDADHWNSINPNEMPIQIPMDFTEDIEERKNAPDEIKKAS